MFMSAYTALRINYFDQVTGSFISILFRNYVQCFIYLHFDICVCALFSHLILLITSAVSVNSSVCSVRYPWLHSNNCKRVISRVNCLLISVCAFDTFFSLSGTNNKDEFLFLES